MSCAVATQADTSSNQASKDPGQLRRGNSNLGKILIKFIATKYIAAIFVSAYILPENSYFPISSN